MTALRTTRRATCLLIGVLLAPPAHGQVVSGHTLTGDWVRVDSNNDPNDLMRISISGAAAVLTSVPAPALPYWKVGDVLWRAIQGSGKLEVRGSDGNYYDADMSLNGPDEIRLTIHLRTAGDDQQWRRAGPDINGDWVRVAPPGTPGDGTRIQVQGLDATVRYLTATAPQVLRVGSRLWQGIGASGGLQVLGSDGQHHPAAWSLVAPDRIQVDAPGLAGGPGQIWVRPASVAAARAAVQAPPANPNQPGSGLTPPSSLPGAPPTPPTAPPAGACAATSFRYAQRDIQWGLGFSSPSSDPVQVETVGLGRHMTSGFSGPLRAANELTDWEPARLPAFQLGQAFVWEPRTRGWTERHDLTAAEFDQENQSQQNAGYRLNDLEAYDTPAGMRYAGVWVDNTEGVYWTSVYDLDVSAYDAAKRNAMGNGLRLVDIEAYETPAGVRWGGVWVQSCDNSTWDEIRETDRTAYQQQVDAFAGRGFQVVDFESYRTSGGQAYVALVEEVPPGRGWVVRSDRTLGWFLNYHQQYEDDGLRLIDFESYDTANGLRYAGVWAENDVRHDFAMKPLLDAAITNYRTTHSIPGISVAIVRNGEVVYRRGFGWADSADAKQANSGTIYMTASVAKVIGGTIAARLQERLDANGQPTIDLSRPTSDFVTLPGDHTHTLEQLLMKQGCVWHYSDTTTNYNGGPQPTQAFYQWRDQAVSAMQAPLLDRRVPNGQIQTCVPGQFYHYSTHGFTFVGAALEDATGKDIARIVDDEIARPLSLASLRTAAPQVQVGGPYGSFVDRYDLAQGYRINNAGQVVQVAYDDTSWKVLGGGLQTHPLDLARFGWHALNGDIVSAATRDGVLWAPRTAPASWGLPRGRTEPNPTVGLAWELRTIPATSATTLPGVSPTTPLPQRRIAEHGGSWAGSGTYLQVYRDAGIVIAIMSNSRDSPVTSNNRHPIGTLADQLGAIVLRNPPP